MYMVPVVITINSPASSAGSVSFPAGAIAPATKNYPPSIASLMRKFMSVICLSANNWYEYTFTDEIHPDGPE